VTPDDYYFDGQEQRWMWLFEQVLDMKNSSEQPFMIGQALGRGHIGLYESKRLMEKYGLGKLSKEDWET